MPPVLLAERPTSLNPAPIEDATRREFITGVGAAALAAAFLAACGGDDDVNGTPEAIGPATRPIETVMGTVEVPAEPTRIVVLDPYASLQVLDELEVPLVGVGSPENVQEGLVSPRVRELTSMGTGGTVDLEAVAASDPDLIVGTSGIAEPIYPQLSEIAPTVVTDVVDGSWREIALLTADVVNRRAVMVQALEALDARISELRGRIAESWPDGLAVSLLRVVGDGTVRSYGTWRTSFVASGVLADLGVRVMADQLEGQTDLGFVELSLERLREADADFIFYYVGGFGGSDADPQEIEQAFTSHPLFQSLTAEQAGRAYRVETSHWFWGRNVRAAHLILDDLFRLVLSQDSH